ncbi:MarR family winged helix-turn-helix transcriptional regulator [Streptomyces europaeiscabiei]|uniref:MarR family winged helix-turn-helix transcriptional regulator n=1 Tax=Streptomyces europaeiscabiei TaxID=146819 RepID=UPI0029B560B2|nr:MarR family winged helix-turn-helix transcriptional regulator [Streptomyces europaeiscabiei]MDX3710455.1 MarR family winged helix-turn-helix transcriptional regulator [Streptomyces europaeiscabiei]
MTTQQTSDAELATQPAAYWTGVAYEALIAFIRAQQADLGFTQPQFWLLRNLSKNDISPDGHGMTIPELQQAMSTYLRAEDDLETEAKVLLDRGWLSRDGEGLLWITESGEEARLNIKRHAPEIRDRIHRGIDDADYVTALKVLQQMIRNTGSTLAWQSTARWQPHAVPVGCALGVTR